MSTRSEGIALIFLLIGLTLISQVQMKLFGAAFANALSRAEGWRETILSVVAVAATWQGLLIGFLAVAQFVVWLMALARLDLSLAIPVFSLGFLVVALGGGYWLGEDLNLLRIAGLLTTAMGISLVICS